MLKNSKMWKVLFYIVVSSTGLLVSGMGNEKFVGNGQWFVHTILKCEDPEQYEVQIEVSRKKINRTHDCFNIYADFDREINDTYGLDTYSDKEVDGGYKYYTEFKGESLCSCLEEHAKGNWRRALELANINPPECPIPKGELKVEGLVIDYEDLTESGIYGKFDVKAYLTLAEKRLACVRALISFEANDNDDEDDTGF